MCERECVQRNSILASGHLSLATTRRSSDGRTPEFKDCQLPRRDDIYSSITPLDAIIQHVKKSGCKRYGSDDHQLPHSDAIFSSITYVQPLDAIEISGIIPGKLSVEKYELAVGSHLYYT